MEHEIIGQISAVSRKEPALEHHHADLGDVRLHYVEAGSGPLVVLLHGFPEFWYSWRFQIPILAEDTDVHSLFFEAEYLARPIYVEP
jgi:hypothetical protein